MDDETSEQPQRVTAPDEAAGMRLDAFLASHFTQHSRVRLRRAITAGGVKVDGRGAKPSERLKPGQSIEVTLPPREATGPEPEPIPIDVIYEDEHLAAVNKPSGMVVHPAKGHWQGTLASGLAHHFQNLSTLGGATRPGIVHRLDRDTTGVLVVAKTDDAHYALSKQFQDRTTEKHYAVVVVGHLDRDRDMIDEPIGPHPSHREKMAIRRNHPDARDAKSFFEVRERFARHTLLDMQIFTGRTHQIRIHLAHIGTPVLCDRLYAGHSRITAAELCDGPLPEGVAADWSLTRQALHAERLKIEHPVTGEAMEFRAPYPDDFATALKVLRG